MKRYSVILADPPWAYNSRAHHAETRFGGGAASKYDVMTTADIAALPIGRDYAAQNCALCLWVTGPHMASGLEVIAGWGFRYVTTLFTWVKMTKDGSKPKFGTGYYAKANAEIVLLGIKGRMKPAVNDVCSAVLEPHPRDAAGKIIHSRKPLEVHRRIERLFGDVARLEVFAREAQPGWDAIGNQLGEQAATLEPQRSLFDWHGRDLLAGGAR